MIEIFRELNQEEPSKARVEFTLYLKSALPQLNGEISEAVKTAYEITGLMNTDFAQSLDTSDPINEILTIAGELEVNPDNADDLRKELIVKIREL